MNNRNLPLYLIILGIFLIAVIIVAAIADQSQRPNNASSQDTYSNASSNTATADLKIGHFVGNIAPDFTLHTIDNKEIKLSDFRGKRVILNFWATWCGPCRYEMPILQSCASELDKSDIRIIAICTQDSTQNVSNYIKSNRLSFIIPLDTPGKVAGIYGVSGLPTTFLIDSDGVITSIKIGPFISQDELEEKIKTMD